MDRRTLISSLLSISLGVMLAGTVSAGQSDDVSESEGRGAVLATAFGYQNDESSTVLVKTFDPATGALLSEDSFTLPGVEETSLNGEAGPARILAGGARIAGQGGMTLSLRVYDARSGRYLHDVNLNVAADVEAGALPTPVIGPARPQGFVRLASETTPEPANDEAPMFSVRAVDPLNDHVVWHNEFEPAASSAGKVERMRYRLLPRAEPTTKDQKYDFQIHMYNHRTGELIWENASSLLVKPAGSPTREDETLGKILPAWPSEEPSDSAEMI